MTSLVEFKHHTACPKCREVGKDKEGDNLGVYADGHKWCFACGFHEDGRSLSVEQLAGRLQQKERTKRKNDLVSLPVDYTVNIPEKPLEWLKLYGITDAEMEVNSIGWSEQHERLIFPVYDVSCNLLMYQGRAFSSNSEKPKYNTQGYPEKVFHILGDNNRGDSLCVVEDIVSCIKVSRVMPCMPLWGSILSTPRIVALADRFKELVIWLDHDKQEYATKRGVAAQPFFDNIRTVVSDYDPKAYDDLDIRWILKGKNV